MKTKFKDVKLGDDFLYRDHYNAFKTSDNKAYVPEIDSEENIAIPDDEEVQLLDDNFFYGDKD